MPPVDRWYDIRETWTGLSGGLHYSESLDSSGDRDDALRRAQGFLKPERSVVDEMTRLGYDRLEVSVHLMDGDDEKYVLARSWRNFDTD